MLNMDDRKASYGFEVALADREFKNTLESLNNEREAAMQIVSKIDHTRAPASVLRLVDEIEDSVVTEAETLRQQCIALTKLYHYLRACGMRKSDSDLKDLVKTLRERRKQCLDNALKLSYFPPKTLNSRNRARTADCDILVTD